MAFSRPHCGTWALLGLWVVGWLGALGWAELGWAQAPGFPGEEQSLPASLQGKVEIHLLDGEVVIEGWEKPEIRVVPFFASANDRLEIESGAVRTEIAVRSRTRGAARTILRVSVPRGSGLEIEAQSASIDIEGVEGDLILETIAGPVKVKGKPASLVATSVTGALDLDLAGSRRVEAETVSGSLTFRGQSDLLAVETVAGAVRLERAKVRDLRVSGFSGAVVAELDPPPGATTRLTTFSGPIVLAIPSQLGASFELESEHGRRKSSLPGSPTERSSGRWSWSQGDGKARFFLESFSGPLEVRPR